MLRRINFNAEAFTQILEKGVISMNGFTRLSPEQIKNNPFELIGKDWGLVTAGTAENFNTMTVSWGGVGILWNKPVAFTFIRPQRYTYEFLERGDMFTLSFYEEDMRSALRLCGSKSGRDTDKVTEAGLTPAFTEEGVPYFEEAKLVLVCKKLYAQDLNEECIIEDFVRSSYNGDDYHRMYVSEIVSVLSK